VTTKRCALLELQIRAKHDEHISRFAHASDHRPAVKLELMVALRF
jgi:hypothetical protein